LKADAVLPGLPVRIRDIPTFRLSRCTPYVGTAGSSIGRHRGDTLCFFIAELFGEGKYTLRRMKEHFAETEIETTAIAGCLSFMARHAKIVNTLFLHF